MTLRLAPVPLEWSCMICTLSGEAQMARKHPRISVMKLAEYMGADVIRRRAIVRDQYDPPDFKTNLYRRAVSPIVSFLRAGGSDTSVIERAVEELAQTHHSNDRDLADIRNSSAALEHFLRLAPQLHLSGRSLGGRRLAGQMWLVGVEVSVRPHLRSWAEVRGRQTVGAIKLSFLKSRAIPEEEAVRAATLMRYYVDQALEGTPAVASPKRCQVVDIFRERVYAAPHSFRRAVQRAEACCAEIHGVWPAPRADPSAHPPAPQLA